MILDEIIVALFSLFAVIFELIATLIVALINLIILIIELISDLFGKKRKIKRLKPYRRKASKPSVQSSSSRQVGDHHNSSSDDSAQALKTQITWIIIAVITTVIVGLLLLIIWPNPTKNVTMMAEDGHILPFATIDLYYPEQKQRIQTDHEGRLTIDTEDLEKMIINDKRYASQTWRPEDIDDQLVVKRSLLGSSLDFLTDKIREKRQKNHD